MELSRMLFSHGDKLIVSGEGGSISRYLVLNSELCFLIEEEEEEE